MTRILVALALVVGAALPVYAQPQPTVQAPVAPDQTQVPPSPAPTGPPPPGAPAPSAPATPAPTPAPVAPTPPPATPVAPVTPPTPGAPPAATTPLPPLTPATVVGRVLSVDDAVAVALENQPQIAARLKDYEAARFRVDEALSPLLPQVLGSVNTTKSQNTFIQTNPTTGLTSVFTATRDFGQTFNAQVQVSQVLFNFGKTYASVQAARKTAEVSFENIELQRQQIVDAVKEAYTNINFARRLIRVSEQSLERAELNLRSARGFFEVGTQPRLAVTRAEVDVANARVSIIQARNAEALALVALNTAMGLAVDTPIQIRDNLVYEPVTLDPAQLRATALAQRPEYRQARLTADAAEASLKQAALNFLPDITGSAFYGGATTALSPAWAATLSLNWTLFDGGNLIARYREAKANLEAAQARIRATELTVAQQVEQAQLSVREAAERIQAAQKAVESAQETFRLAQGRFDAGVGTILELTDAQLALTQTQNTESQALSDYRIALARLDLAVGRR
jgi:outer membrane protein